MKMDWATLKTPLAGIGALLVVIGLMQLLHFPQSMQFAMQTAFGPMLAVGLAGWLFLSVYRQMRREDSERERREAICLAAAESAMRTASDLIRWRLAKPSTPTPASYSEWAGILGKLRLTGSVELIRAALALHERFQMVVTQSEMAVVQRDLLAHLRDYDLLRASRLPSESSEEQERIMGRALRLHEHARRLLETGAVDFSAPVFFEEELSFLTALRKEIGQETESSYFNTRLTELASTAQQVQMAAEADIRTLLAPSVKQARH